MSEKDWEIGVDQRPQFGKTEVRYWSKKGLGPLMKDGQIVQKPELATEQINQEKVISVDGNSVVVFQQAAEKV